MGCSCSFVLLSDQYHAPDMLLSPLSYPIQYCFSKPKKLKSLARRNLVALLVADLCYVIERVLICFILSISIQTRLLPELVLAVVGFCVACNLVHLCFVANYSLGDKRWEMKLRKEREEKEGWIKRYEKLAVELSQARASMEIYRDLLRVRDF